MLFLDGQAHDNKTHNKEEDPMKKLLAIFLALFMLASLAACGGSSTPVTSNLYEAVSAEMMGITVDVDDVFEEGFSLELMDNGKAKFHYEGKDYSLKWSQDGDAFHAEGGGAELDGTLADGVLTLENVLDSGLKITLIDKSREALSTASEATPEPAAEPTEEPTPEPTAEPTAEPEASPTPTEEPAAELDPAAWWEGKWYGWRVNYEAFGTYAEYENNYWDVCAEITLVGNVATMEIWDYEESQDDAFLTAVASMDKSQGSHGVLTLASGSLYDMDLRPGDLVIDPDNSCVQSLNHMIELDIVYTDPDNSDNGVHMLIYLRPWGMTWDDVAAADTSEMPYDDMMPSFYEDWYLPQVQHNDGSRAGTYLLTGMITDGEDLSSMLGLLEMDDCSLILNADGTGTFTLYEETEPLTWTDYVITVEDEPQTYTYDAAEGTITMEEDGVALIFTRN